MTGLSEIFSGLRKNLVLCLVSFVVDLGFVISFFAAMQLILPKILNLGGQLLSFLQSIQNMPVDYSQQADVINSVLSNAEFWNDFHGFVNWIIIFLVDIILIFLVFQGINFFICAKIFDKKIRFIKYFPKFLLFSLFFYLLCALSLALTVYLITSNSKMPMPLFSQGIINAILEVLLSLIIYFWFISLVAIKDRKILDALLRTFRIGVLKFHIIILIYIACLAIPSLLILIPYLIFGIHLWFFIILLLLVIPSLGIMRTVFYYYIEKIIQS